MKNVFERVAERTTSQDARLARVLRAATGRALNLIGSTFRAMQEGVLAPGVAETDAITYAVKLEGDLEASVLCSIDQPLAESLDTECVLDGEPKRGDQAMANRLAKILAGNIAGMLAVHGLRVVPMAPQRVAASPFDCLVLRTRAGALRLGVVRAETETNRSDGSLPARNTAG